MNQLKEADNDNIYSFLCIRCTKGSSADDAKTLGNIKEQVKTQEHAFSEMDAFLPKENG